MHLAMIDLSGQATPPAQPGAPAAVVPTPAAPAVDGDLRTRNNPPATGAIDRFIRRFGDLSLTLAVLSLYAVIASAIGAALAPALWFLSHWIAWCADLHAWAKWLALGFGFGLAFFIAGFALLVVVPIYNFVLPTRAKPFHGGYFSIAAVPWFLHNGLFYLVRYTFLPYVTITPFGTWFLRAMGMKLGRHVFINSEFISDPRLITLGDDVVIGGSVHLFAHFGGGGHLTIAPVVIGDRVTIGEKATVMGDVEIGANATILPHSVLLPGSRVGAGEIWGGVPARKISREEMEHFKHGIHGVIGPHRPASG
jgi:acetyltransferase-like isoleucine patch superfamily enzyme